MSKDPIKVITNKSLGVVTDSMNKMSALCSGVKSQDGSWDSIDEITIGEEIMVFDSSTRMFERGFAIVDEDNFDSMESDGILKYEVLDEMVLGSRADAEDLVDAFNLDKQLTKDKPRTR